MLVPWNVQSPGFTNYVDLTGGVGSVEIASAEGTGCPGFESKNRVTTNL